jgi:hypothetical protein
MRGEEIEERREERKRNERRKTRGMEQILIILY